MIPLVYNWDDKPCWRLQVPGQHLNWEDGHDWEAKGEKGSNASKIDNGLELNVFCSDEFDEFRTYQPWMGALQMLSRLTLSCSIAQRMNDLSISRYMYLYLRYISCTKGNDFEDTATTDLLNNDRDGPDPMKDTCLLISIWRFPTSMQNTETSSVAYITPRKASPDPSQLGFRNRTIVKSQTYRKYLIFSPLIWIQETE